MSAQNLLPWMASHIFYIVIVICLLYLAYTIAAAAYRRRIFPAQVDRRVDDVVLTESGQRKVYTESGSSRIPTESGTRPAAPPSSED